MKKNTLCVACIITILAAVSSCHSKPSAKDVFLDLLASAVTISYEPLGYLPIEFDDSGKEMIAECFRSGNWTEIDIAEFAATEFLLIDENHRIEISRNISADGLVIHIPDRGQWLVVGEFSILDSHYHDSFKIYETDIERGMVLSDKIYLNHYLGLLYIVPQNFIISRTLMEPFYGGRMLYHEFRVENTDTSVHCSLTFFISEGEVLIQSYVEGATAVEVPEGYFYQIFNDVHLVPFLDTVFESFDYGLFSDEGHLQFTELLMLYSTDVFSYTIVIRVDAGHNYLINDLLDGFYPYT